MNAKRTAIILLAMTSMVSAQPTTQPATQYPALQKKLVQLTQENEKLRQQVAAMEAKIKALTPAPTSPKDPSKYSMDPKPNMKREEAIACFDPDLYRSEVVGRDGLRDTVDIIRKSDGVAVYEMTIRANNQVIDTLKLSR